MLVLPGGAVFVAMDETPSGLSFEASTDQLSVALPGWSGAPRTISPYGPAGFSRLRVTADGFVLDGAPAGASAELVQGGVLLRLGGSDPALTADAAAEAMPAPRIYTIAQADSESAPAQAPASGEAAPDPDARPEPARRQAWPADTGRTASAAELGAPNAASANAAPAAQAEPDVAPGPCDAEAAALADAPWDLDLIVAQADCLLEAGERRNAAGLYERVLAFQPEHFRAALGLARLRQQAGRHGDAARLFETAAGSALTDGEALAAQAAARRAREAGER